MGCNSSKETTEEGRDEDKFDALTSGSRSNNKSNHSQRSNHRSGRRGETNPQDAESEDDGDRSSTVSVRNPMDPNRSSSEQSWALRGNSSSIFPPEEEILSFQGHVNSRGRQGSKSSSSRSKVSNTAESWSVCSGSRSPPVTLGPCPPSPPAASIPPEHQPLSDFQLMLPNYAHSYDEEESRPSYSPPISSDTPMDGNLGHFNQSNDLHHPPLNLRNKNNNGTGDGSADGLTLITANISRHVPQQQITLPSVPPASQQHQLGFDPISPWSKHQEQPTARVQEEEAGGCRCAEPKDPLWWEELLQTRKRSSTATEDRSAAGGGAPSMGWNQEVHSQEVSATISSRAASVEPSSSTHSLNSSVRFNTLLGNDSQGVF